jgi:hypothetical protein
MRFSVRLLAFVLCAGAAAWTPGCSGTPVDVGSVVKVGNVVTGWYDAGIVNGENKLVPSVSFTLTNAGAAKINALQVLSVFRFIGETEELGSSYVVLRGDEALGPSATSKAISIHATWGFTSPLPRAQLLVDHRFQDARVEIFAKHGSNAYVKLSEVNIKRQLITH